ncbi:MAG: rhomboid family intramembrane serine protease [Candidatus Pacearchaeota archaeon]|nr:rhomboid family intramembrane serine protease [Candidatus Pacearchaeota archaeon]
MIRRIRMHRARKPRISITLSLIILNVLLFFAALVLQFYYGDGVIYQLALQPLSILQGQRLWTLITSMFMHGNVAHLFVNMLSLLFLGSFLERLIGNKRFFVVYMVSGLLASALFILFSLPPLASVPGMGSSPESLAVGASGAIFGIGGVLAVLTPKIPVFIMFIPIPIPLWLGIILMLVVMWLVSVAVGLPVGNTAHLGGLLAGIAYGFYLRIKYKRKIAILDRYFSKNRWS